MPSEVKRAVRVGSRVQEELARALLGLTDPRLVGLLVSRVQVSDDLQLATVYVRLQSEASKDDRRRVLKALEGASGLLRREITEALGLRFSPKLRFFFDEGRDAQVRIEALLHEIAVERGPDDGASEPSGPSGPSESK